MRMPPPVVAAALVLLLAPADAPPGTALLPQGFTVPAICVPRRQVRKLP